MMAVVSSLRHLEQVPTISPALRERRQRTDPMAVAVATAAAGPMAVEKLTDRMAAVGFMTTLTVTTVVAEGGHTLERRSAFTMHTREERRTLMPKKRNGYASGKESVSVGVKLN